MQYLAEFREVLLVTERTLPQLGLVIPHRVCHLELFLVRTSMCNARHVTDYQLTYRQQYMIDIMVCYRQ